MSSPPVPFRPPPGPTNSRPATASSRGVTVHRYRSISGRDPRYLELNAVIRHDPAHVPDDVARRFIELVGPVCPQVLDEAAASDCDLIALTPYLFWPTVYGAPRLGRRVIFHGAAHDEAELHLPIMRAVFLSVGGFAFNSYAERALVERTFPIAHLPARVIGNSVSEGAGEPAPARAALGLTVDEPFVLCLGRVERDKGSHALADLWRHYRRRHAEAPRLVFIGPVHEALAGDDDVIVAGAQPEEVKWGALRGCEFLIAPSAWESFSLVVLEAWLAGRPVLVNGHCQATVEHCRRSGGGLWFSDVIEFDVIVDRLLADAALRHRLGRLGDIYARRQFSWPAVVDRYATLARASPDHERCGEARERLTGTAMLAGMRHPYLSRAAARIRRSLGLDDMARRLEAIETRLAGMTSTVTRTGPSTSAITPPWWPPAGGPRCWWTPATPWSPPGSSSTACGNPMSPAGCRTRSPGQVFVDVGANIGYFTLLGASLVGPGGRCVGIEAHPRMAELLQRNVIINGVHGFVTTWQGPPGRSRRS